MRGVSNQWGLEVLADGEDLDLDTSKLNSFYIINNIHQFLPSIYLEIRDDTGKRLNHLLSDGKKLTVSLGVPDVHMYTGLNFVAAGMPQINPGNSYSLVRSQGFLDKVGWARKVLDQPFPNMRSSDVISQLASMVGMTADVDVTDDLMTWLPNRSTIAQYARHITERAFKEAGSALMLATTDTEKIKFRDLNTLINSGPTKTFSSAGQGTDIKVLTYTASSKSHVGNNTYGYGSTSMGVNTDGSVFEGSKIEMSLMSAVTSVSSYLQGAVGDLGGRISNMAPLAGNTHPNWYQALHQNNRVKSSYAFDIEILVDRPAQVELLDVIRFVPTNPASREEARALVGNYIVTATTKLLYGNRYVEKIVFTSQAAGGV